MNLLFLLLFTFLIPAHGQSCYVEATLDGAISPASLDFLQRAKSRSEKKSCDAILLLINTPGGSLQSTRSMVEEILNSPVPFLCLIYPSGGHAGSAGAILMQACHVNGAVDATNIGAATPIAMGGEKMPDDLRNKMINDTRSWVEGLAKLRGRNETFAKQIVDEAKAVSARAALELKAIDFVGDTKKDFLQFAEGKKIKLKESTEVTIRIGDPYILQQDLRYWLMDLLMNPQIAYLIFMASLGLLYFEITHPGMIAPGVIGGLGLLISLVSLEMMNVTWAAVLLILFGIALMIAEAFVAGFGILGVGGIVSFFIGSTFLFDPETTGYSLPLSTILPTTIVLGIMMLGVAYLAFTTRKKIAAGDFAELVNQTARVVGVMPGDGRFGQIEIQGETWRATSDQAMRVGDEVVIKENKGLTLHVSRRS